MTHFIKSVQHSKTGLKPVLRLKFHCVYFSTPDTGHHICNNNSISDKRRRRIIFASSFLQNLSNLRFNSLSIILLVLRAF